MTADFDMERVSSYYSGRNALASKHETQTSALRFADWSVERMLACGLEGSVLDVGCGYGRFASRVAASGKASHITCFDWLEASAEEAKASCGDVPSVATHGDAAQMDFPDASFDNVLACHMLYNVGSVRAGIAELRRVLRDDRPAFVTTNADDVPIPVLDVHYTLVSREFGIEPDARSTPFSTENGRKQLERGFDRVDHEIYHEQASLTDAAELRSLYEKIGRFQSLANDQGWGDGQRTEWLEAYEAETAAWIAAHGGSLPMPTRMSLFICH